MHIVHGSVNDTTDLCSDKPLHVNNCGFNSTLAGNGGANDITIQRPAGRKDYQLLYMHKGKARYWVQGEWKVVDEGTCVLYRPFEPQYYSYRSNFLSFCRWIHFTGTEAERLLFECGLNQPIFSIGVRPGIEALFSHILKELQRRDPLCETLAAGLLVELLAMIGRQRTIASSEDEYQDRQRMMHIVEHMQHHYDEPLNVDHYARQCNMSRYYLEHIFTQQIGRSLYAQLIDIRMEHACELLRCSNLLIYDIARMCGYGDPLYFSRAFAKRYEMSPTAYRKDCCCG